MQEYEHEYAEFLYYTPKEFDKESQLWPVRAGRSIAKPNYSVGPKRIECYSLHFVQAGALRLEYEGKRLDIGQDHLFCLFPGVTYHYAIAAAESPLELRWIAIDGPRTKALLALAGLTPETPCIHLARAEAIEEKMDRIQQLLRDTANWKLSVSLELQSLLFGWFAGMTPDAIPKREAEPAGWIRECIDFMELHASEGVSVQQVAAFAGVHRSYFSTVFTRQVGMSPLKYLQQIRMDKARRLLRETDATITEIALSLGYPNLFSFTRAFKNVYSIPPSKVYNGHRDANAGKL
ncbi:HTH-type transcriptional activator RhaS [Paenibacillus allorhizosphaerae]|uniref:HTH-type transcriptional activator RhaS n=2 Tax=Paenibacillus allorhizosphaerae TaxID=2849866 RepID=A0ABN7TQW2_9BACL|nr:AraC family transcriptional regulator [Paenibacillus allorhizosphaerae]CAG7643983.1 HTH-type transcriptional activator RhaS [Paenibacillus allorhizosphaerae]